MKNIRKLTVLTPVVTVLLLLQTYCIASSLVKFTGVELKKFDEKKADILVHLTGDAKYHLFKIDEPPRLVLQIANCEHSWPQKELPVENTIFARIRTGQFQDDPKIVRIVLDLKKDVYYDVAEKDGLLLLTVSGEQQYAKAVFTAEVPTTRKEQAVPKERTQTEIARNVPTKEHLARVEEVKRQEQKRASEPATSAAVETPIGGVVHSLSKKEISVNFVDADLIDVIRVFAKHTNKNILLKTGVSGKVNLRLEKVPLDEVLWTILNENNLVAVRESENVVRVLPRDQIPTTRAYFVLKNRKPEEVAGSVQQAFGNEPSLSMVVDSGSNNLIVTAPPDVIEKVRDMIERLDVKARQIKITSRVMEVTKTDKSDVGIKWEVSKDNAIPFTLDGESLELSGGIHPQWAGEMVAYGLLSVAAILDPGQLNVVLSAYTEKSGVSILNHPSVVVQNNEEANIHIGEDVPYLTYLVTDTGTEQKMETVKVGTMLNVTPSCNPGSDLIRLNLNVEVSELLGMEAAGPHTTTRNASTIVSVTDKQSIIIGGLIRNREQQVVKKVPFLGDIPLIGLLFRNKYTETVRTELFIVLTPELVG